MSILTEAAKTVRPEAAYAAETKPDDLAAAREADTRVTPAGLLRRCGDAVSSALPRAQAHEREDLAADLAEYVAARHGWTPRRGEVRATWLRKRAVTLANDRTGWLDQCNRPETMPVPAALDAGTSLLAQADTTRPAPTVDVDAEGLADALKLDTDAAAAVAAALAGWGSALDLARVAGISHAAARQRLSRGRTKLRAMFPNPAELADALADVDATLRERAASDDRPHLSAAERAARWLLDTLAPVSTLPHAAKREAPDRLTGPTYAAETVSGPATRAQSVLAWLDHAEGLDLPDLAARGPVSAARVTGRRFVRTATGLALAGSDAAESDHADATALRVWARSRAYAAEQASPNRGSAVAAYLADMDGHTLPG